MEIWIAGGVLVVWLIFVFFARRGGGGSFGEKIRESDHWAWREAVKDKERELEQLKSVEPRT